MTWDLTPYAAECQQLYVIEKKSLRHIIHHLNEKHGLRLRSLRPLQNLLEKQGVPTRSRGSVYQNAELAERVRQLWEQHIAPPEQLRMLREEGFEISPLQLYRLRKKQGYYLRDPGTTTKTTEGEKTSPATEEADGDGDGETDEMDEGHDSEESDADDPADNPADDIDSNDSHSNNTNNTGQRPLSIRAVLDRRIATQQNLTPADLRELDQKKRQREVESWELYMSKKRRHRTTNYRGLPADPPGPPRYPSETSLTEVKQILQLENKDNYVAIRDAFQRICEQEGIIKKTLAGPQKWQWAKDRLVRESMHLRAVMWDTNGVDQKTLAIDLLCCDVTKSLRSRSKKISLPEARIILGLNPQQGRDVRLKALELFAEHRFQNRHDFGEQRWSELKKQWISSFEYLANTVLATHDPSYARKMRCIDLLMIDAAKRWVSSDRTMKTKETAAAGQEQAITNLEKQQKEAAKAARAAAKKEAQMQRAAARQEEKAKREATVKARLAEREAKRIAAEAKRLAFETSEPRPRGRPRKNPTTTILTASTSSRAKTANHTQARLVLSVSVSPEPTTPRQHQGGNEDDDDDHDYMPLESHFGGEDEDQSVDQELERQCIAEFEAAQAAAARAAAAAAAAQPAHSQVKPAASTPPSRQRKPRATPPLRQTTTTTITLPPSDLNPLVLYFRLLPASTLVAERKTWISLLRSPSYGDLQKAATSRFPSSKCEAIQGVVKFGGQDSEELLLPVNDQEEFEAYLEHLREMKAGAPTFAVQLARA